MMETTDQTFSFAEFELDTSMRRLLKGGQIVALNPKAFDLLTVLVKNHGQVVSKDELLETVWEGQFVEENNLTVHISALRKLLGEKKGKHQFIVTIPGKGYKFVGEINDESNEDVIIENHKIERIIVDEEAETGELQANLLPPKSNNTIPALLIIALLVLISLGAWFFYDRSAVNSVQIESIAVMPFVFESENSEKEFLSDGMTESLINHLSQLPNLTIKARNSVFHYKGKLFNATDVAKELSVQAILLGRIVERGDQLILSLELVDGKTNNHLWGEQYTKSISDLSVLQNEISSDVSAKLRQKLTNNEVMPNASTANSEAYQLYLRGRYFWNKRSQKDLAKAGEMFEQAIALDRNFALAHAGLGDVYTVDFFHVGDKKEKTAKGRSAALKALDLNPNLAEAYAVLGKCAWAEFNWTEAENNFKRALELNPNYASAHQWYGELLTRMGKTEASIASINRALALDPLSLIINSDAIYIYAMARQYDRAIEQADKTLELDKSWRQAYMWRAVTNEYKGNFAATIADYAKEIETSEESEILKEQKKKDLNDIKEAFEKSGSKGYWNKLLEIENRRPIEEAGFYIRAVLYNNLGEKEKALDSLEKALEKNDSDVDFMKVEPYLESLRAEPRFKKLLAKINLEP